MKSFFSKLKFSKKFTLINLLILLLMLPVILFTLHQVPTINQYAAFPTPATLDYFIYDDSLVNGWVNGSASDSKLNFKTIAPVFSGSYSLSFTATKPFSGVYVYNTSPVNTSLYSYLQLAAQASQPGQHYTVVLYDSNEQPLDAPLALTKYGGDPVVGKWKLYKIPLADLNASGKQIKALLIQSQSTNPQPVVYLDAIELLGLVTSIPSVTPTPTPPMAITLTNIPTAIAPTNIPTPTPLAQWRSHAQAWIYPGSPACNAPNEYKDGRNTDTLKPQYFRIDTTGVLIELTTATSGCNAYSPANVAEIKQYSKHQYVTIAGNTAGMNALITDQTKMTNAITTIKNFLHTVGFTGVEIDFEGFARWTPQQYSGYKNFLTQLGNTLHQSGYKLMIDGPAVVADSTSSYQWHYEDFNALPVDYVVVMEYDWQYDFGAGTPVAPLAREQEVTQGIIGKITDINKIVIGIPSYGYHGQTGGYTITIDTNAQSQTYPGYNTATRDSASAEMMFATGGVSYDYADSQTLNTKRSLIESLGIKNVSVWHLGGNQWFSGKSEPLT